ncbi:Lsr2 family protein [Corynebacterium mendelii]|uniref:Lsr2 family protein n=1 Tax=Corynebacterium mendelii TaxID=2765362 RepID=A0A939E2N8_9CORY|nr:Lsr2 family protein [Corynebacterium mendelii]MBN9645329.1 Lsr2 family protein [Corynebacterium mendelii]
MARRNITQYFDDLDDTPLNEEKLNVVHFSLDGTDYVLDLSESNAAKVREAFQPFISAGRKAESSRKKRSGTTKNPDLNRKIREWAKGQGYTIAERGRIPQEIIDAYNGAHA